MLTPLEIESKIFNKSISGYKVSEVKRFMKEILTDYEKMYRENIELKDKINVLNEGIQYYKTVESSLQSALVLAEKTAEETKAVAKKNALQIEKEAELKAANIIAEAKREIYKIHQTKEELLKSYDSSKIQVTQILKTQLEFVEKNNLDALNNASSLEFFLGDNKLEESTTSSVGIEGNQDTNETNE